jgi:hypothetical protein
MTTQEDAAPESVSADEPKTWHKVLGCLTMLVIVLVCGGFITLWIAHASRPRVTEEQALAAMNRAALLSEMQRTDSRVRANIAQTWKYGASEEGIKALFGEPYSENRDGTGQRGYIWAGNGTAVFAWFRNGKLIRHQVLDEADVKAMKLD